MAEWSKAPDSSIFILGSMLELQSWVFWSPMEAWVRIPLLSMFFFSILIFFFQFTKVKNIFFQKVEKKYFYI